MCMYVQTSKGSKQAVAIALTHRGTIRKQLYCRNKLHLYMNLYAFDECYHHSVNVSSLPRSGYVTATMRAHRAAQHGTQVRELRVWADSPGITVHSPPQSRHAGPAFGGSWLVRSRVISPVI